MAIKLGGAGGGSEINDQKVIYNDVNLITTESGEKWLKSGVVTSGTLYPNAKGLVSGVTYANASYTTDLNNVVSGITTDGTFLYITRSDSNTNVYKYTLAMVFVEILTLEVNYSLRYAQGIYYNPDDSFFYIVHGASDNTGSYFVRYKLVGAIFKSTNPSVSPVWGTAAVSGAATRGCAVVGNMGFVLSAANRVFKYSIEQNNSTSSGDFAVLGSAAGMTAIDGFLWVLSSNGTVYKYTTSGTLAATIASSTINVDSVASSNSAGFTFAGDDAFWVTSTGPKVYKYDKEVNVGMPNADTTLLNGTRYVRVL